MDKPKIDDELAHPDYWNQRYKDANGREDLVTFVWYRTWEHLELWFQEHLTIGHKQPRILHLGCGNSTLTADLSKLGFHKQNSIDFSEVIRTMEAKYKELGAGWKVMDVRNIDFGPQNFDIAIDKATMDMTFHGSMWDPPDDVRANIGAYLSEVDRILVPGGTFIYITYRQPPFLCPLLAQEVRKLEVEVLPDRPGGGVFEYFAYVMTKYG